MMDDFYRYPHQDGSSYSVDIALPDDVEDKYHVDLVRQSQDEHGLQREQRQTLAQYKSYGEAEEHLYEAEDQLQKTDLADFDIEGMADLPYSDEPLLLAVIYPPDAEGDDIAGAHLLALDANGLTTVSLAQGDAQEMQAIVTKLDATQATAGVEQVLDDAQEIAQSNGQHPAHSPLFHPEAKFDEQEFSDPLDLASLNPEPEYYFGYGIGPNDQPSLEAVKTWMDGAERRFDTLTVGEYGMFDEAAVDEHELETLMDEKGVEAAMNLAESMASTSGYLNPERDDPRIFFEDDAPPDSFMTKRGAELQEHPITLSDDFDTEEFEIETPTAEYRNLSKETIDEANQKREANANLEGTDWFEATFDSDDHLLEPLDPTVNYALIVQASDPWTLELAVEKLWKDETGYIGIDSQTVQTYDPDDGHDLAQTERDALLEVYDERGLETMMHKAELEAMQNGYLDADRVDTGLFSEGPPDRFETLAQRLEGEPNPYWNTDGEKIDEAEVDNPYWRLDTLPVNDPDGEALGHAMHMVVYDGIENDSEQIGTPHIAEDEPFRMLEMAHFETTMAADKFGKEFNGYLMPGLLEGPELAVEVARLEGMPAEWQTLKGDDLKTYQNTELTLTRPPEQWHPYNPNAERDARIEAEGLHSDPIYDSVPDNDIEL